MLVFGYNSNDCCCVNDYFIVCQRTGRKQRIVPDENEMICVHAEWNSNFRLNEWDCIEPIASFAVHRMRNKHTHRLYRLQCFKSHIGSKKKSMSHRAEGQIGPIYNSYR